MAPVLQLDHLTRRFGREVALDDVSLEVPPGVVFALLGENGAGKTTALRIALGLLEPNSGETTVLGLNSRTDGIAIRRRVGYVPERPMLYEWMTVDEIGWFSAGFYPEGYLLEYRRLAQQYQLPPQKRLKSLSKGMRAKVALALALAHDPELLLLDEPTSGLDTLVRREFLESMVDRAALGQTVVLSSHQIVEVERVADIVAILRKGRLVLVERLDELKSRTRELVVSLRDDAHQLPPLPGQVISRRRRARQWMLLLRDAGDHAIASLRLHPNVHELEDRTPSLEEIFVAYMEAESSQQSAGSNQPSAVSDQQEAIDLA